CQPRTTTYAPLMYAEGARKVSDVNIEKDLKQRHNNRIPFGQIKLNYLSVRHVNSRPKHYYSFCLQTIFIKQIEYENLEV
ncbi:hypothetical protein JTE90_024204, partial [Oedothorax gibbosus]